MSFVYLAAILVSMVGMLGIDYKYRLAFFDDARATSIVLVFGLGIFSVWDLVGISLGIFLVVILVTCQAYIYCPSTQ